MPLTETSIAGYVALTGKRRSTWRTPTTCRPARPTRSAAPFDEKSGYRTKSMLVVPMRDHKNKVIGVVQLINKKRDAKAVLRPVDARRRDGHPVHARSTRSW